MRPSPNNVLIPQWKLGPHNPPAIYNAEIGLPPLAAVERAMQLRASASSKRPPYHPPRGEWEERERASRGNEAVGRRAGEQ